jgi:hypothetical protein
MSPGRLNMDVDDSDAIRARIIKVMQSRGYGLLCIADLRYPPSASQEARIKVNYANYTKATD